MASCFVSQSQTNGFTPEKQIHVVAFGPVPLILFLAAQTLGRITGFPPSPNLLWAGVSNKSFLRLPTGTDTGLLAAEGNGSVSIFDGLSIDSKRY